MIYTEEEKKAIEMLDKYATEHILFNIKQADNLEENIKIVLNLVEKQQKEIENQKNIIKEKAIVINNQELGKAKIHNNWQKELKENYVPKEVIRRKMKELENQKVSIKVGFEKIFETKMDNAKIIDTLRELLRGE